MLTLLGGDPEFSEPSSLDMPEELTRIVAQGFELSGRLVLLRALASSRSSAIDYLKDKEDETGIEAFINEIHIEDLVPGDVPFFELVRLGCDFGFALGKRLCDEKFGGVFRVIVSAAAANEPSDNIRDTCVVRFHQQREHQSWLNDDLESYREEAIAVLDF
ncbi:MAG: hypothetical protein WA476_18125 [Acidobacteriaceae bacterium]